LRKEVNKTEEHYQNIPGGDMTPQIFGEEGQKKRSEILPVKSFRIGRKKKWRKQNMRAIHFCRTADRMRESKFYYYGI